MSFEVHDDHSIEMKELGKKDEAPPPPPTLDPPSSLESSSTPPASVKKPGFMERAAIACAKGACNVFLANQADSTSKTGIGCFVAKYLFIFTATCIASATTKGVGFLPALVGSYIFVNWLNTNSRLDKTINCLLFLARVPKAERQEKAAEIKRNFFQGQVDNVQAKLIEAHTEIQTLKAENETIKEGLRTQGATRNENLKINGSSQIQLNETRIDKLNSKIVSLDRSLEILSKKNNEHTLGLKMPRSAEDIAKGTPLPENDVNELFPPGQTSTRNAEASLAAGQASGFGLWAMFSIFC